MGVGVGSLVTAPLAVAHAPATAPKGVLALPAPGTPAATAAAVAAEGPGAAGADATIAVVGCGATGPDAGREVAIDVATTGDSSPSPDASSPPPKLCSSVSSARRHRVAVPTAMELATLEAQLRVAAAHHGGAVQAAQRLAEEADEVLAMSSDGAAAADKLLRAAAALVQAAPERCFAKDEPEEEEEEEEEEEGGEAEDMAEEEEEILLRRDTAQGVRLGRLLAVYGYVSAGLCVATARAYLYALSARGLAPTRVAREGPRESMSLEGMEAD